ncbi:hypothetical protein GQ55_5G322800 [Panicum hallii var. hallii]|uniref:HMA domain-containing protein n=1 Tax=Panicum hallii var. hallii TaxID=1504633 RepID=A0A2T7DLS5_9POAL|nr:hypothetical protein GQ55_5G322800 [Panicum hallii var. hallii]
MASLLRWKDKYVKEGLSCSSSASTSVVVASGRAIDRHSPRLRDPHRRLPPSLPRPPGSPYYNSTASTTKDSSSSLKQHKQLHHHHDDGKDKRKKKSSAEGAAAGGGGSSTPSEHKKNKKKQAVAQLQQVSPASSSRFLLNSSRLMMQSDDDITVVDSMPPLPSSLRPAFIEDEITVADSLPPLPSPRPAFIDEDMFPGRGDGTSRPFVPAWPQLEAPPVELFAEASAGASSSSSSLSSSDTGARAAAGDKTAMMRSCSTRTGQHQVVVLRVSLHCKGCAGKVKKHISKMEGVSSFDIDIATKKVTVVGDVTPLGVLNSISKVKSAQFWPDHSLSSLSSPPRASASF